MPAADANGFSISLPLAALIRYPHSFLLGSDTLFPCSLPLFQTPVASLLLWLLALTFSEAPAALRHSCGYRIRALPLDFTLFRLTIQGIKMPSCKARILEAKGCHFQSAGMPGKHLAGSLLGHNLFIISKLSLFHGP